MAVFKYKALARDGKVETGQITADDRPSALKILKKRGLQPVNLTAQAAGATATATTEKSTPAKSKTKKAPAPAKASKAAASSTKKEEEKTLEAGEKVKLKKAEIILFTEELSEMLRAGLQLEPALKSMENREELGNLKLVSQGVRQLVRDGSNFSVALRKVSDSFGPLYCNLAAAGEASGALDTILERQAHYLKTLSELQSKVVMALIYPAFLVVAGISVSIIFMTKLIPQLTKLIVSTPGGEIPTGAKIMMAASDFFQQWWMIILGVVVTVLIIFKAWKDAPANRLTWDETKLKIPLIGKVIESRFYVQFLETLANLVGNGLPLLRALELTRDATMNLYIRSHMDEVIEMVGDGRTFSRSLLKTGMFPPLLIDMVVVGEKTGKLDHALRRAAERFDSELGKSLQRIMALIMPIVLIMMAGMIGMMAYLMVTAIFQTISNLQ
ncbi:type II secretion system F family protein [Persicirhabdus sediminis]|uniref:Type II secretion system F family protein n=1 Tax=Persicirhabdus sediminis TaxID=454144 RepID=A0A8J7SJ46_9BACT|nr:type II secretion system F family protein [Persicirhabdus sediminis]MBK1789955.1 type II secretion system F family protein [Persicirhabdus sediminis]